MILVIPPYILVYSVLIPNPSQGTECMFATRKANAPQKEIELELVGNPKLKIEGYPKKREAWALSVYVQTYASACSRLLLLSYPYHSPDFGY